MIAVQEVSKAYGRRSVLDRLHLEVRPGAVSLLVGANGAGKSTLLRILAGLSRPDAGTVKLNAVDLASHRADALEQLSFLPQAPHFHPRLTTRQVATYYGRLRCRNQDDVTHELATWELLDHADVVTGHLSGGLRQRLAIAIFALVRAPILLLDEPGLSLDPFWRGRLQGFLMEEARAGRTVLVATHLLGEWQGHADACYLMQRGTISDTLPPERLRDAFARAEGMNVDRASVME